MLLFIKNYRSRNAEHKRQKKRMKNLFLALVKIEVQNMKQQEDTKTKKNNKDNVSKNVTRTYKLNEM